MSDKQIVPSFFPPVLYNKFSLVTYFMHVLSHFSHVWLFVTLWTNTHQALLAMGFSRQEYWSELPCPPPGDLPDPGLKPASLKSPALTGRFMNTVCAGLPKVGFAQSSFYYFLYYFFLYFS